MRRSAGPACKASEAEILAEVKAAHIRAGDDLMRLAFHQNLAGMDEVGAVDERKRFANVMIGDENTNTSAFQMTDEVTNVTYGNGINSG